MLGFDVIQKSRDEVTSYLGEIWLVLRPDEFAGCSSQCSVLQVSHPSFRAADFGGIRSWTSCLCLCLPGGDLVQGWGFVSLNISCLKITPSKLVCFQPLQFPVLGTD